MSIAFEEALGKSGGVDETFASVICAGVVQDHAVRERAADVDAAEVAHQTAASSGTRSMKKVVYTVMSSGT